MIKNILICNTQIPYMRGGAEVLVEELNRQLNRRGFNSEIVTIPYKWYPQEEMLNGAIVWRMIDLSEVNGVKIDRVICTKFPNISVRHDNKVIWLLHQERMAYELFNTSISPLVNNQKGRKIKKTIEAIDIKSLTESKKIFTISKNVTARLMANINISSEVLYPPIEDDILYQQGDFGDYVFSISRLDKMKRMDVIVEAMKYVKTGVKLKVGGKGPEFEDIQNIIRKNKLESKVELLGFISNDNKVKLYKDSLGVIFVPIDEDYGYITIEAFKSGKPVITACDSGGSLEFVEDGVSGYVVNCDPQRIAEKIDKLYIEKEKTMAMGKEALKKVHNIDWDDVIIKMTADY